MHLEGSIPPAALQRLAKRAGRPFGAGLPGRGGALQQARGFASFLDGFVRCAAMLVDEEAVATAAGALIAELRHEGILYAEVTVSPQVHLRRGLSFPSLMAGLGRARRAAMRAGGPRVAYVADGGRLWGPGWFAEMAEQAAAYRGEGIVAVGLGGDETEMPASAFLGGFERARALGLHGVVHAGERGGPEGVRDALALPVERVGHAVAAARDPGLLREIAARGLLVEVCPTSNVMTGAVASYRDHPLRRLLDAGVKVALGSDDRTLFGTSLRREFAIATADLGVAPGEVPGLIETAIRGSFAPPGLKRRLLQRLRAAGPLAGAVRPSPRGR